MTSIAGHIRLTVTAKGQVTLKKDLLRHLGVAAGGRIEVTKLADGDVKIRAKRPSGDISEIFGMLKQEGQTPLSIDEINEVIAQGWANRP